MAFGYRIKGVFYSLEIEWDSTPENHDKNSEARTKMVGSFDKLFKKYKIFRQEEEKCAEWTGLCLHAYAKGIGVNFGTASTLNKYFMLELKKRIKDDEAKYIIKSKKTLIIENYNKLEKKMSEYAAQGLSRNKSLERLVWDVRAIGIKTSAKSLGAALRLEKIKGMRKI